MAENLGLGVSNVSTFDGYSYDTVVFQKGKPPLDTELNLLQDIRRELSSRQLNTLPSGWITFRPYETSSLLQNRFYTQDSSAPIPEYALVNGMPIYVTNTGSQQTNVNIVDLGAGPVASNQVNGVYMEVWRALLNTTSDINRPLSTTVIDNLYGLDAVDSNNAWAVGENGLILMTSNGGLTWAIQAVNTKNQLNGVSFINSSIGWVVGDNGVIVRTSSGGLAWTPLTSGTTQNLMDVYARSQLLVWVVGASGTILKSPNGINWVPQSSTVTADLNSVYFYNDIVGWIAGAGGVLLKTTDGGQTWRQLASGTTADLNSVYFNDLNFGFAVGNGGIILESSDGGTTWVVQSSGVTVDLTDVTITPSLDQYVNGEDISSQFTGSNKNCTVMNVPVSVGDGHGTITNDPTYIIVKVNGVQVGVDSLDGTTGHIILTVAPHHCDIVKVYYWYKIPYTPYSGVAFITGKTGTVLRSSDLGQTWVLQTPNTSYDLNASSFIDKNTGWVAGQFSTIRYTIDSGTIWTAQTSDVLSRRVQRVFNEGNIGTSVYLIDNTIHPDVNIETTERVQIQYCIRIVPNVDPFDFPDAGLGSSAIVGLGPNTTGSFAFVNMGSVTGDYGLYQAQCPNTVDGYCWAIPMAFVNRRNQADYSPTNTNGSTNFITEAIRADLLTSTDVVDADILDVRRRVAIPSITELLDRGFEALMNNTLRTNFARNTEGGDRYGTQLLQLDQIGGVNGDGGQQLFKADGSIFTINDFFAQPQGAEISSTVTIIPWPPLYAFPAASVPVSISMGPTGSGADYPNPSNTGYYHQNSAHYSATYYSSTQLYNGKTIPGYFTGMGTQTVTFYFYPGALDKTIDSGLNPPFGYKISADWVETGSVSLIQVPTEPQLVTNYSKHGAPSFYFRGVLDTDTTGRVIEKWDSGIPNYFNYVLAFPGFDAQTTVSTRASTVELHYFMQLTIADIDPTNNLIMSLDPAKLGPTTAFPYTIHTISKINNVVSNFSYKISNTLMTYQQTGGTKIIIQAVTGYSFIVGAIIEIVAMATSQANNNQTRNGATVNFSPAQKGLSHFCASDYIGPEDISTLSALVTNSIINYPHPLLYFNCTSGNILGTSTVETVDSLTQAVVWVDEAGSGFKIYPVIVTYSTSKSRIQVDFEKTTAFNITSTVAQIQILFEYMGSNVLPNSIEDSGGNDGIMIGYYYTPTQSVSVLPLNLTVDMATKSPTMYVSDIGTGGSLLTREPFDNPLLNIPVNDSNITDDNAFSNVERLRFPDFSVSGGFAQMPVYIPGNFGGSLTFSGATYDGLQRYFYNACSSSFSFETEGLLIGAPRKIFIPAIGRVESSSDGTFLKGEYILIIFSRNAFLDTENYTGYQPNDKSVIAIYRLPNKPLSRV